ncbi:ROK family transcriptional regulator [Deinococcus roseus]|uniref:Sugar kinase n=1 Tax=Deinococcus roseus TaxID=392414 RepID=A0ABQ2D6R0_9DEIO|nr:ROK family transcriptional regulator [Deinococcus roseus]GGJ43434.1 sugar kinase [Deinococcus roseus]
MLSGTNIEHARLHNRRVVLEAIRLHHPLSRADIARKTGLTLQAVSNIVAELADQGIVEVLGKKHGGRGQPSVQLQLRPDGAYSIGLHLDRDHVMGLILDLSGQVRHRVVHDIKYPHPHSTVPLLLEMVQMFKTLPGVDAQRIWGVGMALPAPVESERGLLLSPANFPGWDGFAFREELQQHFQLPLFLENDATAAAIGERWYGAGREHQDFFYIYFGLGIGGGMLLGNQPYHGGWGNTGEIGHIPVEKDGLPCSCGGRGCLERYAGLGALYGQLEQAGLMVQHPQDLLALYEQQHPVVLSWLEQAGEYLAMGIVTLENLMNPEVVFLGGRLPDPLLAELISRIRQHSESRRMTGMVRHSALRQAALSFDAACYGAASLPLFSGLSPTTGVLFKTRQ